MAIVGGRSAFRALLCRLRHRTFLNVHCGTPPDGGTLSSRQSIENHFSPREGSARVSLIGDWLHPVVMKSSPLVFILRAPDCDILLPLLLVLVICFYHVYIVQWLHKYQCFVRRQARFKDGLPIIICFLARKDRACHTPVSPKGQRFQIS
jgi:hypothetical protein